MIERVLKLIEEARLSDSAFEKKTGIAQGTVWNWRSGRNKLSSETVIKIANLFNISADYILCLTDEPKPIEESSIAGRPTSTLSTELAKDHRFVNLAKLYKAMPNEFQSEVYAYIFGVAVGLGLNVKQILK